ncbi:MAG TPA: urease subunit beta [Verrucomicrobiae bacterium]|jgi:urease subunit beta|nr:urease subunit beta [Verrucomicrobiae bacterium]
MNFKPGEYLLDEARGTIQANVGRRTVRLLVQNTGDRPIQVGSHYHFFETNSALAFDRALAYGMRLNIAAGTAVRFEPGEEKEVTLTEFGGRRVIHGFNGLVEGPLEAPGGRERAVEKARKAGFERGAEERSR